VRTKQKLVNGLYFGSASFGSVGNTCCFLVSFVHEKVEFEDGMISFFFDIVHHPSLLFETTFGEWTMSSSSDKNPTPLCPV
jgi:hypothetical protein